jgi:hypothetical protein
VVSGDLKPPTDFSFHKTMQADLAMLKHAENGDPEAFLQFIQKEDNARRIGLLPPLFFMDTTAYPSTRSH